MPRTLRTLLLVAALLLPAAAFANNWDRFLGPNGTGSADDKDVPVKFDTKTNLLWKVPIPGNGNSSPVVWGKHVYLQAASNDGKTRTLLCLDTDGGKVVWEKSIDGVKAKIRYDSSLASSTPAVDADGVYVAFWNGKGIVMAAYDHKGTALWSKDLGPFISQHGAGASPILYKDKVILANDMDKENPVSKTPVNRPSILIALDKKTGSVVWEVARDAVRACYSAPFLMGKELVVVSTSAITGYNPDDGAKVWEFKNWQGKEVRMPLRTVASPALVDGTLIATSGDGGGDRFAVGVPLNGAKTDLKVAWKNLKDFPYVPCPLSKGEHVYFVNDAGFAGCFDARTGKKVWLERQPDARFTASPVLIDGKIYAASEQGDVFVFAADPSYKVLARNPLGERVRATPAVADNRLYVRGETHLFCIGKAK